jgi:hypothetical protein
MKFIFLTFFIISFSFADDIVFKFGKTITNVQIIEEDDFNVKVIKSDGKQFRFRKETILTIIRNTFNANAPSEYIDSTPDVIKEFIVDPPNTSKYPNLNRWPISVLSFGFYFALMADSNNIQTEIDERKNISPFTNTSDLEDKKKLNNILGFICLVGGIVNTVYMVLPLEVSAKDNQLNLSYRF